VLTRPLPGATAIIVTIDRSLESSEGELVTPDELSSFFNTYGDLVVARNQLPDEFTPSASVVIPLSNELNPETLDSSQISITSFLISLKQKKH
jgi:hypothetical protein